MELTVENLSALLIRSRLLPTDEVKSLQNRWSAEAKGAAPDSEGFMKWLVGTKAITDYQATLLRRGHVDNFFILQYKILDRIGRGRMAGVYKAVHQLGQTVAIKVLPPSRAKDPHSLARFQREARLAIRLKHPNIVRAFQMGEANGLHFIVMEYLDGETLDEVLNRRQRLPINEAVRLTHQILQGVQHIHEQGLVHRDIKPSNMMLVPARKPHQPDTTQDATLKILDIGLGKALFDEALNLAGAEQQLTNEGVVLGTPDYLAPEQGRNAQNADARSDIYSVGCVLYHLLTGQPPFPDTNIISQMMRHQRETPKPLSDFLPGVPDGLQQILNWMLAKAPEQRYPTPERAAQALQVFMDSGGGALHSPETDVSMSSYLVWLENQNPGPGVSSEPRGRAVPAPAASGSPRPGGTSSPSRPVLQAAPPRVQPEVAAAATQPPRPASSGPSSGVLRKGRVSDPGTDSATRKAARKPKEDEAQEPVDVELVPAGEVPAAKTENGEEEEFELTRRDFMMAGAGAGLTFLAVVFGYVASRLAARKDPNEDKPRQEDPAKVPAKTPEAPAKPPEGHAKPADAPAKGAENPPPQ